MKRLITIPLLLLAVGCTHTKYTDSAGNSLTRTSFGTTQNIGRLAVKAGDKELVLEGYSNEQAQVAAAVVSAAISAVKK